MANSSTGERAEEITDAKVFRPNSSFTCENEYVAQCNICCTFFLYHKNSWYNKLHLCLLFSYFNADNDNYSFYIYTNFSEIFVIFGMCFLCALYNVLYLIVIGTKIHIVLWWRFQHLSSLFHLVLLTSCAYNKFFIFPISVLSSHRSTHLRRGNEKISSTCIHFRPKND